MDETRLGADTGLGYAAPTSSLDALRLERDQRSTDQAALAEEVPVALVYNKRPHVVMMCSPRDLEDFAVGFTITEGIAPFGDIEHLAIARHSRGIEVDIGISAERGDQLAARARAISGRTGCGLCGIEAIDDVVRDIQGVSGSFTLAPPHLYRAAAELEAHQPLNQDTHAIHAAGWADVTGRIVLAREDVGRHNALDKTLGALYRQGLDPKTGFVVLTSRASFELVQKAALCGVSVLAAVSRPTGLGVRLAERAGMTLVGLLRGESAIVYSHPERIRTTL